MGLRPTKGDEDAVWKISWQAKAPAPRWRHFEWGRRFRLPTVLYAFSITRT